MLNVFECLVGKYSDNKKRVIRTIFPHPDLFLFKEHGSL